MAARRATELCTRHKRQRPRVKPQSRAAGCLSVGFCDAGAGPIPCKRASGPANSLRMWPTITSRFQCSVATCDRGGVRRGEEGIFRDMGDSKNELSETIIGCIIKVHQTLGPGFLESVYRPALMIELRKSGLNAETEKEIQVRYEGEEVGRHRLDILVESTVIVELKTVEELARIHYDQLRS